MAPPNYEFQEWWNKERENHGFLDKNDSPCSLVEIRSPQAADKDRSRNAKQLSWVFLLKAQQAANYLAWLAQGSFSLIAAANRRISSSKPAPESRFYNVIKFFLIFAVLLLLVELGAYWKGWHFNPPSASAEVLGFVEFLYSNWVLVRANYLAPPLQMLANVCVVLFLIQSLDRVVLMFGCFWIRFRNLKPVPLVELGDVEHGNPVDYPKVLIQIPMCNEREENVKNFYAR